MELDKAFLNKSLGGLFLRIPIGLYFFLSGRLLLQDVDGLSEAVKSFGILNEHFAALYANSLPYIEIAIGFLLVTGFMTSLASLISIAVLASFVYGFGIYPNDTIPFNKDIIWISACMALLTTGAGAFSIDSFRYKGS